MRNNGFIAIGMYFYVYSLYADLHEYVSKMWGLTSRRNFLERVIGKLIIHFITFSSNFLSVLSPDTLFLLFIFNKEQIKKKQNPFLAFLVLTFLVNFIIYLISPSAKIRYTYMFFPMIIFVLTYPFYNQLADNSKKTRIFYGILRALMLLLSIVLMVTPFVKINANLTF